MKNSSTVCAGGSQFAASTQAQSRSWPACAPRGCRVRPGRDCHRPSAAGPVRAGQVRAGQRSHMAGSASAAGRPAAVSKPERLAGVDAGPTRHANGRAVASRCSLADPGSRRGRREGGSADEVNVSSSRPLSAISRSAPPERSFRAFRGGGRRRARPDCAPPSAPARLAARRLGDRGPVGLLRAPRHWLPPSRAPGASRYCARPAQQPR